MENEPLEYVFPIENGDIPANYVGLPEGTQKTAMHFPNKPLLPPTPILSSNLLRRPGRASFDGRGPVGLWL